MPRPPRHPRQSVRAPHEERIRKLETGSLIPAPPAGGGALAPLEFQSYSTTACAAGVATSGSPSGSLVLPATGVYSAVLQSQVQATSVGIDHFTQPPTLLVFARITVGGSFSSLEHDTVFDGAAGGASMVDVLRADGAMLLYGNAGDAVLLEIHNGETFSVDLVFGSIAFVQLA